MRGQAVPYQGELVPSQVVVEVFEELNERGVVVGTGAHVEDQPGIGAVGGKAHGRRHREALPVEAMRSTGVWPLGAQVALTEGRSENPDSSWKQTQALLRRAFFLPGACLL